MDDYDDEEFEEHSYFVGPCTCDHEREDHSWGGCGEPDCDCEAGWEE
jgi:hypothetical protein